MCHRDTAGSDPVLNAYESHITLLFNLYMQHDKYLPVGCNYLYLMDLIPNVFADQFSF